MLLRRIVVTFFITLSINAYTAEKEIAITIDDLPFVGSGTSTPGNLKRTQDRFNALINALVANNVPATGFAIGGAVAKNEWDLLESFRDKGFALGNHTYTHQSLGNLSADKYINDIEKADKRLSNVLTQPKYFRYPYLAEGAGEKKQQVLDYLKKNNYTVAPVTIDSKDYEFNAQFYRIPYRKRAANLEQFKKRYLAYIWKQTIAAENRANKNNKEPVKQILLIHANLLNSLCLESVLEMYKNNGYKFISLAEALKGNTAQPINDNKESTYLKPPAAKEAAATTL